MSKKKSACEQIMNATHQMGDTLNEQWKSNKSLKTANTAISAYGAAINAAKAMVIYQKTTNRLETIEFFEKGN